MKIYVGLWKLLPDEWEGYNGLVEKNEEEISLEVLQESTVRDLFVGEYTHKQFEDMFNGDLVGAFNNEKYWIRIF